MKTVFTGFKPAARIRGDHDAMLSELTSIYEATGALTPADVVEGARDEDSALHEAFEWDDSIAAQEYRLQQAGGIIRAVVTTVVDEDGESHNTRALLNVSVQTAAPEADGDDEQPTVAKFNVYKTTSEVMADPDLRQQALANAYRELAAFKRKYEELVEIAEVLRAIDRVLGTAIKPAAQPSSMRVAA